VGVLGGALGSVGGGDVWVGKLPTVGVAGGAVEVGLGGRKTVGVRDGSGVSEGTGVLVGRGTGLAVSVGISTIVGSGVAEKTMVGATTTNGVGVRGASNPNNTPGGISGGCNWEYSGRSLGSGMRTAINTRATRANMLAQAHLAAGFSLTGLPRSRLGWRMVGAGSPA
jgi:hypothetical protein